MNHDESIVSIYRTVEEYLAQGLVPDSDLIHFINSAYGINGYEDIAEFISNGYDSGAVIELISYPSDALRKSVEKFIPDEGIPSENLNDSAYSRTLSGRYFILLENKKIILQENDSLYCCRKLIWRLNLHMNFSYLSGLKNNLSGIDFYDARMLLRKRKFISGKTCRSFMKKLIAGCSSMGTEDASVIIKLINTACALLNNSEEDPADILSVKMDYYKNAYIETVEFSKLLKSYSMEFIMMKKIQPPLITAEEALSKLETISRLLFIVYGVYVPVTEF
jgi:hypothetical protein